MCCVVAKKYDAPGCIAWKTQHGKELSSLIQTLNENVALNRGIQLVVISDPEGYGEYAPYNFVFDESSFKQQVLMM